MIKYLYINSSICLFYIISGGQTLKCFQILNVVKPKYGVEFKHDVSNVGKLEILEYHNGISEGDIDTMSYFILRKFPEAKITFDSTKRITVEFP